MMNYLLQQMYTKAQALFLKIIIDMDIIKLYQFYALLLMIVLKHHQFNTDINKNNHINKHNRSTYTQIIIKKFLLFFFTVYKNEQKEHKFLQQKYQKSDFYNKNKKIFHIDDIDVNKILVSKKEQYGKYGNGFYD